MATLEAEVLAEEKSQKRNLKPKKRKYDENKKEEAKIEELKSRTKRFS